MAIANLPDEEFKIMVIKMLTELWRRMDEHTEYFNKGTKYKKVSNRNQRAKKYSN